MKNTKNTKKHYCFNCYYCVILGDACGEDEGKLSCSNEYSKHDGTDVTVKTTCTEWLDENDH